MDQGSQAMEIHRAGCPTQVTEHFFACQKFRNVLAGHFVVTSPATKYIPAADV